MKITSIKLKNINSLKGEHCIDFENGKLKDAGLFVITGPTGAGKSTILDVITLALYNRIPRISGIISKTSIEEEGIVLTKNTTDCFAEVTYTVQKHLFRSHWSIRRTRTGSLSERQHELVDVSKNQIISSSISQVPSENERIIGLSYEQFVQSMLLAQGQFSKLLLAKKDERNALLEEITGTSIYRQIGKKVYEKFSSVSRELKDLKLRMGEIQLLSTEKRDEMQQSLLALSQKVHTLSEKCTAIESQIQVKKNLQEVLKKLTEVKDERKTLDEQIEAFSVWETKLKTHDTFLPFKETWSEINRVEKQIADFNSSSISENNKLQLALNEFNTLLENVNDLIGDSVDEENFVSQLSAFKQKVTRLFEEEKTQSDEIEAVKNRLKDQLNLLKSLGYPLEFTTQMDKQVLELKNQFAFAKAELDCYSTSELEAKKSELELQRKQLHEAVKFQEQYVRISDEVKSLENTRLQAFERIATAKAENDKATVRQNTLEPQIKYKTKALTEAKTRLGLSHHRNELIEGEPCPLCGATEHPFATHLPDLETKLLENELQLLQTEFQSLGQAIIKNEQIITLSRDAAQHTQQTIEHQRHKQLEISTLLNPLFQELGIKTNNFEANLTEMLSQVDVLWQKATALANAFTCEPLLDEVQQLFQKGINLKNKLLHIENERKSVYARSKQEFENLVSGLQRRFDQLVLTKTSLQSRIQEIENQKNELQAENEIRKNELVIQLQKLGLNSISALAEKLLDDSQVNDIRIKQRNLDEQNTALKSKTEVLIKQQAEWQQKDNPSIDLGQIENELVTVKSERDSGLTSQGVLKRTMEEDDEKQAHFAQKQQEVDELQKVFDLWNKMNTLIGDATGKKFANFVQELTMKQLIALGNQRLKNFSDRYIMDIDSDSGVIKVEDTYMGNAVRSVSSLSGGETFKLSLALAFGLSDLASQNVVIESLFIDEGFGTLDPESLDQAITILEHMQNTTNKSIGIISHVGELKERIQSKIKLERVGAGFSKIVID